MSPRFLFFVAAASLLLGHAGASDRIPRDRLIDDTRELFRVLESVHPDPYVRGGGKIAFHRRVHRILGSIPDEGMSAYEFYERVRPAVAAVGDGHTTLVDPHPVDPFAPGGIPLYFETAAEGVFVAAVLREEDRDLFGGLLLAVEGVPFDSLVARHVRVRAADNRYQTYRNLGTQGALWNRHTLASLVPEWSGGDSVRVILRLAGGDTAERTLPIPERIDFGSFLLPPTERPALIARFMSDLARSDFFYLFPDDDRRTCLLVIHDLMTYREAFEAWRSFGGDRHGAEARALYRRYRRTEPPDDPDAVIAGLPSATELFRAMVREMREAGTRTLLVDVSQNGGGSSLMGNMLVYFLHGKRSMRALDDGAVEIVKYSPEFFDLFPSPGLDEINRERSVPLLATDYDFRGDGAARPGARSPEEFVARTPTFAHEFESGAYAGYYRPENIFVLCDAGTYSAAFTLLDDLRRTGAVVIGVPSAQAGNCFGDVLEFTLPRSRLEYRVSRKYFERFPGDPGRGTVLEPDHMLTWGKMAAYGFDPAALVRFAEEFVPGPAGRGAAPSQTP